MHLCFIIMSRDRSRLVRMEFAWNFMSGRSQRHIGHCLGLVWTIYAASSRGNVWPQGSEVGGLSREYLSFVKRSQTSSESMEILLSEWLNSRLSMGYFEMQFSVFQRYYFGMYINISESSCSLFHYIWMQACSVFFLF